MQRKDFIERTLRQIYGGQPSDDSNITVNLVNNWLTDATAIAAKKNYTENYLIDGLNYVNNSFYTTFRNLTVTKTESNLYQLTLPEIPIGIGYNNGISLLQFVASNGVVSHTAVPLSENQLGYIDNMRPVANKLLYYPQGKYCFIKSVIGLTIYTGKVTMVSAGDSTDLTSELTVPSDYYPTIVEYIKQQLLLEQSRPKDNSNDGVDN